MLYLIKKGLPPKPAFKIMEFVRKGKASKDPEKWKEYDSNGNEIHYKDNDGYEKWCKYDSNGNMIHYKDNEGFEQWL